MLQKDGSLSFSAKASSTAPAEGQAPLESSQVLPVELSALSDIINLELPESIKLQQKLTAAVEADDAEAIRSILPELLKDYVKETETLRENGKKLKEAEKK